jgi:hypothetical protein
VELSSLRGRKEPRKPLNPHDFGQFPGHVPELGRKPMFAFP